MIKILLIMMVSTLLISCGGGGGGSGGGDGGGDGYLDPPKNPTEDDDKVIIPEPDSEPYISGLPITHIGNKWTIEVEGETFETTSTHNDRNIYFFDEEKHSLGTFNTIAASNAHVDLIALVLQPKTGGEPIIGFGMNGEFSTSPPSSGTMYFNGQYTSMSTSGEVQGIWEIEIYLDFNDISNSYAIDMNGGNDIQIHFVDIESDSITGSISDLNHDYHLVSFALFGKNAETIAGGYANETGAGVLIGER